MISCRQLTERADDFDDGRLSLWSGVVFRLHIGMCGHCRTYVKQLRLTRATLAALPPLTPPEALTEALQQQYASLDRGSAAAGELAPSRAAPADDDDHKQR